MVVASMRDDIELPTIDLHSNPSEASRQMVKACEEYGFFRVINHGVPQEIITGVEEEAREFFSRPGTEKGRAGPANPYGYGCRNIGLRGDVGEVEYLILQTNTPFISNISKSISAHDPNKLSFTMIGYVEAVRELACRILDLIVKEMCGSGSDPMISELVRDASSDSVLRLNHYPRPSTPRIGFGEHTDPQILTLLTSNGIEGLQISLEDGVWVPLKNHPVSAFYVNVGDVLQVMTNGRFKSVKHRVVLDAYESRMSTVFFAAPPLHATINCLSTSSEKPPMYRSFTWGEYKKATYGCRLGDSRLSLFQLFDNDNTRS